MIAFLKKECMETARTHKLTILLLLAVLFGIMNPMIAKLTPKLIELLKDSMEETGLTVSTVKVDAMTGWTQYFKNIPMLLIIFVIICSDSFTGEYRKNTLVPVVTKGLSRRKIYLSKFFIMSIVWTGLWIICTGITLVYIMYFWGNDTVNHMALGLVSVWVFGMMIASLLAMFGAVASSAGQVLLFTGAVVFGFMLAGYIPKIKGVMPTRLLDSTGLFMGKEGTGDICTALVISLVIWLAACFLGMLLFDKKKL